MRELFQTLIAELRGMWRFRWLAVGVAWLVCLLGWAVVLALPNSYESRATIYVDTSSALKPLLESLTVETDVLSRVELVTTAMLGRPQLERVARQTDVHLRAAGEHELDQVIAGMRSRITLGTPDRREPNLYEITYRDMNPKTAQDVVTNLLNTFVEDSLGVNRLDTQRAQDFLRQQLSDLEAELVASEQRLSDFKRENVGRMPGEGGDYFARLQSEMAALEKSQSELRLADRRRDTLQQQLTGEDPTTDAQTSLTVDIDNRIAQNEARLEELRLRFTDQHPDVIAVRQTLEQLREQKESALRQFSQSGLSGPVSENPVYQSIQIELSGVNVEIAALSERVATHQRKVNELRELIDVLPEVEAELARLNRDYDVKQAQYQSLLQRLEVAELSESADQTDDVKFRIIDPPLRPDVPVAPNRPLLLAGVLLGALGVGGGIAFLANQLRPVFSSRRILSQVTGFPVLGSVTAMRTRGRRRRHAFELGSFSVAVVALVAAFLVIFMFRGDASQLVQSLI